jgi:NADH dehydrogenase [ubiquinone] 1 alpha subcomplex assembly factor 3
MVDSDYTGKVIIDGVQANSFSISHIELKGSLVLFPRMFFAWDVAHPADIRAHHFDILDIIKPMPSTLV